MNNKIEEIRKRLEAATPDWEYNGNEIVSKNNLRCGIGGFLKDEDNELAANAPADIAYLLTEIDRLKKALEDAQEHLMKEHHLSAEDVIENALSGCR